MYIIIYYQPGLKYTIQSHTCCVWDINIPLENNDIIPPNTITTCSSDNTIRFWSIDSSSKINKDIKYKQKWTNIYSRDLARILCVKNESTVEVYYNY